MWQHPFELRRAAGRLPSNVYNVASVVCAAIEFGFLLQRLSNVARASRKSLLCRRIDLAKQVIGPQSLGSASTACRRSRLASSRFPMRPVDLRGRHADWCVPGLQLQILRQSARADGTGSSPAHPAATRPLRASSVVRIRRRSARSMLNGRPSIVPGVQDSAHRGPAAPTLWIPARSARPSPLHAAVRVWQQAPNECQLHDGIVRQCFAASCAS